MQRIIPPEVPTVGPYSPAVRVGPWIFLSGQIALRPDGTLEKSSIEEEASTVMHNLLHVLRSAGATPSHLVKVTIYLTDMAFFPAVNAVYEKFFPNGNYPARETVAVAALPRGARIEISGIAYAGE
ncbi:MAG: RidA family protein [Bacteroidia bacterium]|nr:RidA family protein [Bacteroidia bacterium]MDW8015268.1 RidA family protein [Bacteroidia bacterium]